MLLKKIMMLTALSLISVSVSGYATDCTAKICAGMKLPASSKIFIENGYANVEVRTLNDSKYLFLNSEGDVNKCSVIFKIQNDKIESFPTAGEDGKLCNVSAINDYVVSAYRDQGTWINDVYQVLSGQSWTLLFSDFCTDCQQVKRVYYKNGIRSHQELMSEADDFTARKPLNGTVLAKRIPLYSEPSEQAKTKAYLVKGDGFKLSDMSDDGSFYQIQYTASSGKKMSYWIKSDDFEFK
ncbi:hypothetical protein F3I27_03685 [Pantoea sp. Bo_2]|uniref:hypothetical protein n=1 Tax=unclassified Pantoea TaxID=2630326 RepID=UPI0012327460|nr:MULTISPECIES: hypothetical protein [unclassified Pantoea]KAA5934725.1 hypothetical protein F3I57_23610 [Pantoea sp. VH_3]KAA5944137.1 hypothetical protein F3I56_23690 [Pantoea sp. VH_25]KAA5975545.1 hypothetical protein F3I48_23725 [Pantoea sp. M_3]KAA6049861.1 hypothetical protein F3I36_03690 [Pantoea sp. FN_2b]KAA6054661.1 hypothetical protein F3I34_03685 [Pantoea sp. Bo_5]